MKNFKPFSELKKKILADPEVKKIYDELEPEYQLISAVIEARIKRNMSQKDLAEKMGTGQSAISRLESGTSNPSFKFLQKVAKALNTRLVISLQ
jgi:ribosome-binding protein aMBF1 (putative translation factor)